MGCLREQMPPECKEFVENTKINFDTTNKLMFSIPFHRLWRTRKWKKMVNALNYIISYAGKLVKERISEIAKDADANAELGDDFLTYMILSGKMGTEEIAVNAIDLLGAGVDTVSASMDIRNRIGLLG
jgi:cytochrome P450